MNQIPDCGTCTRRECPDHGQPQHMRTVLAEECAMRYDEFPERFPYIYGAAYRELATWGVKGDVPHHQEQP